MSNFDDAIRTLRVVTWQCPHCQTKNSSTISDTAGPVSSLCGVCGLRSLLEDSSLLMWRVGQRRCRLVASYGLYRLEILDGSIVSRSEPMVSVDKAWLVAHVWRTQETDSLLSSVHSA